jgi:hypothetical protein
MIATAVRILETLASLNRVLVVAAFDSKGFSMPSAVVCSTEPSRNTAAPTEMSPTSTVEAAITASNAAPSNLPRDGGKVVVVDGGVVDVVVVVDSVVVVSATVVVVEVDGAADVAGALDVGARTAVSSGVDTDLAAV